MCEDVGITRTFEGTERASNGGDAVTRDRILENSMNLNPWYLVAPVALTLLAVSGAMGAQLAVLGVTLGIFFGTLSLGRSHPGDSTSTNPGH